MGFAENAPAGGKDEMLTLATSAFDALQQADLDDVLDALHKRVFDQSTDLLFDFELVDGAWRWRYKPMVELILRQVRDAAIDENLSPDERRAAMEWALSMSGF